jgi:squalene cyclase
MFSLESLSLVGETYENSKSVQKACDYLVGKQREDGGWGESWEVGMKSQTCVPYLTVHSRPAKN